MQKCSVQFCIFAVLVLTVAVLVEIDYVATDFAIDSAVAVGAVVLH